VSDANLRQIRVLHVVSAGGVPSGLQPSLFMPLLTRLPRQRVKSQVACLSRGAVPAAILRQNGVPTFDIALSRQRFSPRAFHELRQAVRHFRPDVIQAWGHTAQIVAALLRKRCDWKPRLVWSIAETAPLARNAGLIDRQKLKYAAKLASGVDRIVYTSEAAASQHRRVGFPDGGHEMIPPGVDATRFKPDFAARRKLREELNLPGETFVIGMVAPFQPESDHATLIKALGELVKTNPNIAVVLAGHGVQKGNASLIALIGSGALSTRVHLLGEWSDISALYNACDVVCCSSINDQSRMNVVMAMLCGVPCIATGIGAQGEIIGQHGIAIEPGNPTAFVKAITRVMQLTPEKRTHMAQGARKHALTNYVYVRSLQKYLQLYHDLIGRQALVTQDLPTPEIDATLTVPPALPTEAELNARKRKPVTVEDLSDPDSLEAKVAESRTDEELPKWRIEQEQERGKREAELAAKIAASNSVGDVLQVFESQQKSAPAPETPMNERARGVTDETEELLPAEELLAVEVPAPQPRVSHTPAKKSPPPAAEKSVSEQEAAKQAALKAARMAALQPIAPVTRPVAAPKAHSATTKPPVTQPASPATRPPASASAAAASVAAANAVRPETVTAAPEAKLPAERGSERPTIESKPAAAASAPAPTPDIESTQPLGILAQELANAALPAAEASGSAPTDSARSSSDSLDALLMESLGQAAPTATPEKTPLEKTSPENTSAAKPSPAEASSSAATPSTNFTEFGELALLATGEWQALQSMDVNSTTNSGTAATDELSAPEALSLISTSVPAAKSGTPAAAELSVMPEESVEPKRAASAK
jgi:glycosyltransferase involved in cell wall biosynthesis